MDIEICPLRESDIPEAMELKNALGWNQIPGDWRRFLLLSPEGCFKALMAGQMVATAVASVFDRVCWVGMVIVKEVCRHQGVGRQIVTRCLEFSRAKNCDLVALDATREGVSLYGDLGFRPESLVASARARLSAQIVDEQPGRIALQVRRIDEKDLEAAVSLEARATGAVREALLRQLLGENPGRGFVCHDRKGGLKGFVLHRPGFHSHQVGPLIAENDDTAERLLQAALCELTRAGGEVPVIMTVPMNNRGIQRMIRGRGFSVDPRLTRMTRGRRRLHAREELVYAFSGPEMG
ncbi:MAG: GNAT family N-acetyltransferase [Spirochaetales bacterium]|nr:GNAT family N-acetyltransferase [Spirochaetales bacterium]